MFKKDELSKKTIKELKEISNENNIKFDKNTKKNELITLLLDADKKDKKNKKVDLNKIPDLPKVYGKNKMVFMIRDPFNGFVYWDMSEELIKKHKLDDIRVNIYLRVYDVTENTTPGSTNVVKDIKINENANSWYISFPMPNKVYLIELGYFKKNQFITILQSNSAKMPRADVSKKVDNEWILTEKQFEQIMQASGADVMFEHDGSQELMKFLAGNIGENISS